MLLLLPFAWLVVWIAIAVVACALLGLPPGTKMLDTALLIFVCGGILLPIVGLLMLRLTRHKRTQN